MGRGQKTEVRRQRSEDRGQRSEDRRQRSEDRGQRAEGRGQSFEVGSRNYWNAEVGPVVVPNGWDYAAAEDGEVGNDLNSECGSGKCFEFGSRNAEVGIV
jgi:hypothetical protein